MVGTDRVTAVAPEQLVAQARTLGWRAVDLRSEVRWSLGVLADALGVESDRSEHDRLAGRVDGALREADETRAGLTRAMVTAAAMYDRQERHVVVGLRGRP